MERAKHLIGTGTYFLLAYMPFHIFLSQSLSLITGGLYAWKIAKDVALLVMTALAVLLVWRSIKAPKIYQILLGLLLSYGLVHILVWAVNPAIDARTAMLGSVYNNRVLWLLLLGFSAVLLQKKRFNEDRIIRLVLLVSTMVVVIGVLQYFLPKDVLTHLGYSVERGVKPNFFIDDKPDLPRIMSSLRDPNSLGAYLIIPITLLLTKLKTAKKKMLFGGLFLLHGLALFLTFSRAAWAGTALACGLLLVWQYKTFLVRHWVRLAAGSLVVLALVVGFAFTHRDNYIVQNIILHSDENTVAQEDSNELHVRFVKDGIKDIVQKPIGHGPGTAGIVSIHNEQGVRLTENYYVQIAYEVGVVGLALFIAALVYVYCSLKTSRTGLSIVLQASLAAYMVMGLIMHIWTNEAVAAQWWLLAGIVIGLAAQKPKQKTTA